MNEAANVPETEETELPEPEPSVNPAMAYLDSCFYLDYLQGDKPYHGVLEEIIEAWKRVVS